LKNGDKLLLIEKACRIFITALFSIWVARVYGPAAYGELLFAISFIYLFITFASLGMENYMVQNLSIPDKSKDEWLVFFWMRMCSSLIASLSCVVIVLLMDWNEQKVILCFIVGIQIPLLTLGVFQATLKSMEKFAEIAVIQLLSLILSALLKSIVLFNGWGIGWIAFAISLDAAFVALVMMMVLLKTRNLKLKFNIPWQQFKIHFKRAGFLLVGAFSAILYMRIDQLMVMELLGAEFLGKYGVVVKLVDGWIPLLTILVSTSLPRLTRAFHKDINSFEEEFIILNSCMMKICFLIAVLYLFIGDELLEFIFGESFKTRVSIIGILCFSLPFVLLSNISWSYYLQYNLYFLGSLRLVIGALLNIVLNFIFIEKWGLIGCVFATVISYSVSSLFIHVFFKSTRKLFSMQLKGLISVVIPASWLRDLKWVRHG